jgi:hypothetical protein
MRLQSILLVVLVGAAGLTGVARARTAPVPQNTSPPTIGGTAREGNTVTARNGTWTNAPTSFAYQWQRCGADGTGCTDIRGAANQTYTLASADADHTVRVQVTGKNADGQTTANSAPTAVVSSRSAPVSTGRPTIAGTPEVGEELAASNAMWSGGATSFTYRWQRCTSSASCANVDGATARPTACARPTPASRSVSATPLTTRAAVQRRRTRIRPRQSPRTAARRRS